jgi:tetratricopeptide (TPR) repeat protein
MLMSTSDDPVREYAMLLLRYHALDPRGQNESPELNAICDAMDSSWRRMDRTQRQRVEGLSIDLYALADGRQGTNLGEEERRRWADEYRTAQLKGDPDLWLEHFRRPYPHDFASGVVLIFQARLWDELGLPEVSVLFYEEAAKVLPAARAMAMDCYRRLNNVQQAKEIALQLLRDSHSSPLDTCLAASTLFLLASRLEPRNPKTVFEAIVSPLRRTFEDLNRRPIRQQQDLLPMAARALAFTLLQLDKRDEVREVCERALLHFPSDPSMFLARGLANLKDSPIAAEADFRMAVTAGTPVALPYAVLAWFCVIRREYPQVLWLSSEAIRAPELPPEIKGLMFELHGIAQAELKQDISRVEEDFARALRLNPDKAARIEENRKLAINALQSSTAPVTERWSLPDKDTALQLGGAILSRIAPLQVPDNRVEAISDLAAASVPS